MKRALLLLILVVGVLPCVAQTFKGKVVDEAGRPVPFASLYLREIKTGFTTDDGGYFRTSLNPGEYTCEVSSIGFSNHIFSFKMAEKDLERDIILAEQVYALNEVEIVKSNEDPAYTIMRQAIARAPYYRSQIKGFTAGTYLKGTGKLTSIPAILKLSKEVRTESKKVLGKLFVLEEQRQVTFKTPDKWDNRIIAYRNSFPEEMDMKMGLTTINFYEPTVFGKVSPLSRGAFSYYQFKFEGCYTEGNYLVNKIKVIPKKGNPRLVGGELFIVEDLWCVAAANLSVQEGGMKGTVKVTCKEVQPSVFMPTSTSMSCSIHLMGVKAEASYLAAMHYTKVEVNKSIQPEVAQRKALSPKAQKINEAIAKITSKENLTVSDAYKLSKLMEKSIREADTLKRENKYELASRSTKEKEQTDSLAGKKDSLYWATIRSVPLRLEEVQSFVDKEKKLETKDSLNKKKDDSVAGKVLGTLLLGKTFRTPNKKAWISLLGLSSYVPQYNLVDGFWVGAKVKVGVNLSESTSLQFIPSAYYTTARHAWLGQGELQLNYAPRRQGQLAFAGGAVSADYNQESGESLLINSIATSFFGRNDVKFFEKRFLMASHQIELTNGLQFFTSLSWQRRAMLENHVSQSWFKKKVETNLPDAESFCPMPENELLKASFALEYTPAHYYRMYKGKKLYQKSRYPTFRVSYDRAFPLNSDLSSPSYHLMEFSARQKVEFGMFNEFCWSVNAGTFWHSSNMQFPDYHHFAATKFPVTERTFNEGFSLLDNYAYSTDSRWAKVNLSWYTPYLLVKQFPFLKKKLFDEALHLRSLVTYDHHPYTEIGYSVGHSILWRVGVFVGFERLKYTSVGVSLSIPILRFMGY